MPVDSEHAEGGDTTGEGRRGLFRRTRRNPSSPGEAGGEHHDPGDVVDAAAVPRTALNLGQARAQRAQAARSAAVVDNFGPGVLGATATMMPSPQLAPPAPAPVTIEDDIEQRLAMVLGDASSTPAPPTSPAHPHHEPTAELPAQEAPVQQPTAPTTEGAPAPSASHDDIEARLDAVLAPTPRAAAPHAAPVDAGPPSHASHGADAEFSAPRTAAPTAAALLGIDVERMVERIEEEAQGARQRIELEVRSAGSRAEEVIGHAEQEAERIREHGQAQARVLLGEVEEIISEAQQTGEQILQRADMEAAQLRQQASEVFQQAQAEARAIVDGARREGEQVLAEQRRLATVRAQESLREQDRLKDQIRRLEERRRQVLESLEPLISQLTQMMPTGEEHGGNVVQLDRPRSGAGS